jgi:asparagine synthase (glutamine-hydrolysing)
VSYLRHACVPAPRTIYRNVAKVEPGHRLEVDAGGVRSRCYWDLATIVKNGQASPDRRPEREIIEELHALLRDATRRQMVSDVPLGAFLSGGIDSSAVVALMQSTSSRPVKTFSIGFREQHFNEADHARAVARHLQTEHTELVLSAADAQAIIPQLPTIYDEPFADSSQLPTYLVSRLARKDVTVALSGDGGDEVFGGYVRHQAVARISHAMRYVPGVIRRAASGAIGCLSPAMWDQVAALAPRRIRPAHFGEKILKGADLLTDDDPRAMYKRCRNGPIPSG